LGPEEQAELDRRRAGFDRFLAERMPMLADFAERLGLPNPPMIVASPTAYVDSIASFMREQQVKTDDRPWILARLGYFIGEVLIQRFWGSWFLNDIPGSRYFARYVVGHFARVKSPNAMIDPFYVASVYVDDPPGRDLHGLLREIEAELVKA